MKKERIVYKVVSKDSTSVVAKYTLQVFYRRGRRVSAPIGKLFAFSSEQKAKDWISGMWNGRNLRIFECIGYSVAFYRRKYMPNVYHLLSLDGDIMPTKQVQLLAFWRGCITALTRFENEVPKGTVTCSAITPIKEL